MDVVNTVLCALAALSPPPQAPHWEIVDVEAPEDVVLEVSGLALLPDGRPMVATRRGEVWIVNGAYSDDGTGAVFSRFAAGLQEPLGLLPHHDGWIYVVQRGELSRMRDTDGDDRIDELETVCDAWRISGNYHEYNFGPRVDREGDFWITTNKPFGDEPFGRVDWRGWALRVTPTGEMIPTCNGLRSPAGVEIAPWGDAFYTDNQGEWCGASKLAHLEPGDFHGHPWGVFSSAREEWPYDPPGEIPDGIPMPAAARSIPRFKLPAVWFPYDEMGRSPSGFVWDTTGGRFGPFPGQVFVGDQYAASVMRVSLERIGGRWQGACYPFVDELACGVVRLAWGRDRSLFAGLTSRGWGSVGASTQGLQRIVWKGTTPFVVQEMRARDFGFELEFTLPVDPRTLGESSWTLESYTYLLHSTYGSDEVDRAEVPIEAVERDDDGQTVRLRVARQHLRSGYVHELRYAGVRAQGGERAARPVAYYTLVALPE